MWATQGWADTTISSGQATPVATSTAAAGAPDNVVIDTGGAITVTSGTAVTLDSNNTVSSAGAITIQDASDAVAILARGGLTGSITNTGAITVNETTVFTDTDGDGDLDGPFATGARRYGVRVTGPGGFSGPISNGGSITVQGDDSAAVSLETDLIGTLSNSGTITAFGSRASGIHTTGTISGDLTSLGSVSAIGDGAQAISVGGDVTGGLIVQGVVSATGYRNATRSTDATVLANLDADDLLQGGPALSIMGNVGRGLLIDVPPIDLDPNNTDEDGDGIDDSLEGVGSVTSYGAAPAIVIGAAGRDVSLGNVGTADNTAYGLVIRGSVTGSGVYDGVSATGVQLGVAGGGRVTTGGGVYVSGSVTSGAYLANATSLLVNPGAEAPRLFNAGAITAAVTGDGLVTSRGVAIEPGASVSLLQNGGTIAATLYGEQGDAVAVADKSGTLSRIENTGRLAATIIPTDDASDTDDADTNPYNEAITGHAVALDVSANTSGVALVQYDPTGGVAPPAIVGSVLLGSGSDRLDILAGSLTGDIAFGAGANQLDIDGGATVLGALTAQGGTLGVTMGAGTLQVTSTGVLNLSTLSLASTSKLLLTIDPVTGAATRLEVAGAADIATGAQLGLRLTSVLAGQATYTLIHAGQLDAGTIDSTSLGATPYIYGASVSTDAAAGTVSVTLARKSATDLALPAQTATAYDPILQAAGRSAPLGAAILSQTDRAGLMGAYNQMLPDYSGGVFELAAAMTQAFGAPLDDRQDPAGGGAWVQELDYRIEANGSADRPGYSAWGMGLVGGYERPAVSLGVFGLTLGLSSAQLTDDGAQNGERLTANTLEGGVYWRNTIGAFSASARLAGDYMAMSSNRVVTISAGDTSLFQGSTNAKWSGLGLTGRLKASYEAHLGPTYLRPQLGLDYFRLSEQGYHEAGTDALTLNVDGRTSARLSGYAGLALGAVFGQDEATWGPELSVGYRQVASETLGSTTANFVGGGDSFNLLADQIKGGGFAAHLSFKGEDGTAAFALEAGAEKRDTLLIYDLKLAAHFAF